MTGKELKKAIEAAEGRTVCCETGCSRPTFLYELSNAEIAKAFGGDMVLLNGFDCIDPLIYGAEESENPVQRAKELSGLPIGANLEPVDMNAEMLETRIERVAVSLRKSNGTALWRRCHERKMCNT